MIILTTEEKEILETLKADFGGDFTVSDFEPIEFKTGWFLPEEVLNDHLEFQAFLGFEIFENLTFRELKEDEFIIYEID